MSPSSTTTGPRTDASRSAHDTTAPTAGSSSSTSPGTCAGRERGGRPPATASSIERSRVLPGCGEPLREVVDACPADIANADPEHCPIVGQERRPGYHQDVMGDGEVADDVADAAAGERMADPAKESADAEQLEAARSPGHRRSQPCPLIGEFRRPRRPPASRPDQAGPGGL